MVRDKNEDFVLTDGDLSLFFLADGMGGVPGGEVASALAVESAHRVLVQRLAATADADVPRLLADAFAAAHSAVFRRGLAEPELTGLGTTLDVLVLRHDTAWCCHVGDGRIYVLGSKGVERLTIDDNYAAMLAQKGAREDLVPGWARHVLTQAVGISNELYPEIRQRQVLPEDVFVMCSDGVTGPLSDSLIASIVRDFPADPDTAADKLVVAALERGGTDNVSVIVVRPEASLPLLSR